MTDEEIKHIQEYVKLKNIDYDAALEHYLSVTDLLEKKDFDIEGKFSTSDRVYNFSDLEYDFYDLVEIPNKEKIESMFREYIISMLIQETIDSIEFTPIEFIINGEKANYNPK